MNSSAPGLEAATDRNSGGAHPVSSPSSAHEPQAAPGAADDFLPLRLRLARMLGRPKPLLAVELHNANLALTQLIEAPDAAQYLAQHHPILPPAAHPLLLTLLAGAWAEADTGLACALEKLHRLLTQRPVPKPTH